MDHAYPSDLARFALERLAAARVRCDSATLARVLSVAYQASLLREEERARACACRATAARS
jgi:hypothetical protein